MATVTICPSCSEKLRLPDALRDQKVRCPQCSNIFTAVDSSVSAPAPRSPGVDEPSPSDTARTPPDGAREINLSLDDSSPQLPTLPPPAESEPPRREPSPPDRPSSRAGRTRDDEREEEQIRCPVCRRKNEADARRCYHCGERLTDSPRRSGGYPDRDRYDDDWQQRRRRDTIPHRGGLVLAMGIVSLVMLVVFTGLGLPFGIVGWWLGQVDLRKIRDKQMDPEGEGMTRTGWILSIIGTVTNGLCILGCVGFFVFIIMAARSASTPSTMRTFVPTTAAPPVQFNTKPQPNPWDKELNKDFPKNK